MRSSLRYSRNKFNLTIWSDDRADIAATLRMYADDLDSAGADDETEAAK